MRFSSDGRKVSFLGMLFETLASQGFRLKSAMVAAFTALY
jgi:hypothetical protein